MGGGGQNLTSMGGNWSGGTPLIGGNPGQQSVAPKSFGGFGQNVNAQGDPYGWSKIAAGQVGSSDWLKTHPNYPGGTGGPGVAYPQGLIGGYPQQQGPPESGNPMLAQGGGWDISQMFQHLFG